MKSTVRVLVYAMLVAPLLISESFGGELRKMMQGSAIANRPKTPQTRMVSKQLLLDPLPAGSYTIGVGGYFPTIDSAYRRLEAGGIGGPVTLLLADTLYVAPFPPGDFRLIGPIAGAGPASRITIRPADNVAVTIQGSGTATLTFQNVSYVTLDGINLQGSTRMKVHTLLNSTFGWNDAIDLWGDCDHNIIQNVTACSDQSMDLSTSVIMLLQDDVAAPDSCLISGVSITSGAVGIYIGAGVYGYSHRPNGNVVRGCHIGSPTDSLISRGITIDGAVATIVENNHVENLKLTLTFAGFTSVLGIQCYYGNNTIIRNNVVHGMRGTSAANIHAILGHGDATHIGQGLQIYNNMIYDLQNTVTPGYGSLAGICFWSTNDILVAFNTVWLSGTGSSPYGTDALNFWEGCTNVTVRNNILVNTCRYQAAGGIEQYQITAMFVHGATTITSDNNDLYVDTSFANNWTVRLWNVGNYRTLGSWQATGRDAQSVSLSPSFRSVTDLHIDTLGTRSQWTPLANAGTPITGSELDIDGTSRVGGNYPDIGADEFWISTTPPYPLYQVRRVPLQYPTIQIAIDASINGDTVLVSDGTYNENIQFRGKKIVVASTYLTTGDTSHISQTIIDGSGAIVGDSASVVYFISGEDTNSVLCGFTVRGGKGTSIMGVMGGGGVYCTSGARLVRNIITQNTLSGGQLWGGGVDAENGKTLIMEQNIVSGNTLSGTWGGGAGIEVYNMKAIIRNNTVVDNTVSTQGNTSGSHGGGITCESGTFTIVGNLIARNRALAPTATMNASYGGGFLVRAGVLEFRNNRVVDNLIQTSNSVTAFGGGICLLAADVSELRNMIISGNYIGGNAALGGTNTIGGGIGIRNEKPRIENNIIERNTAVNGGGIGVDGSFSSPPAILVNNTIIDNQATQGGGALLRAGAIVVAFNNIFWADSAQSQAEISVSGSTAEVHNCDVQGGYAGTGNMNVDPAFVVGDSVLNLTTGSPCIGHGVDSILIGGLWYRAPAYDFDGNPRPRPSVPQPSDIGAQEEQVTVVIPNVRDGQPAMPNRFALEQNYPNPFNPTTGIGFQVPGVSEVKLVVYDLLGREVAVLVSEKKAPGSYEVKFDAARLASGMYLYQLTARQVDGGQAGSFVQTRKMIVVK